MQSQPPQQQDTRIQLTLFRQEPRMNFMSSLALSVGTAVIAATVVQTAWAAARQWRAAPNDPAPRPRGTTQVTRAKK